jgi:hypothetical protein
MSASIVTRSGPTGGYTCYVKGNEGIYTPPGATNGYIDRKFHSCSRKILAPDTAANGQIGSIPGEPFPP